MKQSRAKLTAFEVRERQIFYSVLCRFSREGPESPLRKKILGGL